MKNRVGGNGTRLESEHVRWIVGKNVRMRCVHRVNIGMFGVACVVEEQKQKQKGVRTGK